MEAGEKRLKKKKIGLTWDPTGIIKIILTH